MNTRLILPAILSAVVLSSPVLAAGGTTAPAGTADKKPVQMTMVEKCTSLEKQFDAAIKSHEKAAKASEAKTLRTDGGNLCTAGRHMEGVLKLEQALKDLGVQVKY